MKRTTSMVIFFIMILTLVTISCQGAAGFNPFATETPLPTLTFTSSPTLTQTTTPSPTATQAPSPTSLPSGAASEEQSDGSTLFTDYDNQYQLTIPQAWLVVPLSMGDITDILETLSEENPQLKDTAAAFAQLDPNVIRVIAVNEDTKYLFNGFSTNITVTAVEDKLMSSMPLDFVTGAVQESLKPGGATIIENQEFATTNANGVEIGIIEFQQTAPTAAGTNVPVHSKILIFQSSSKLIMIQLTTPNQFASELFPVLEQIRDTIKRVAP